MHNDETPELMPGRFSIRARSPYSLASLAASLSAMSEAFSPKSFMRSSAFSSNFLTSSSDALASWSLR
jgi:hypothetical protein